MTQFRSKKDGSHYPISGGRVIYPKGYDEWKDKAMVYKDRANKWWITYHDGVTGPYKSKKEAIEYSASSGNTLYEERSSDGALVKIYPIDNRNLYGGQYRMSQELADAINKNLKFSITNCHHAHNMSAFEDRNHFDVSNLLINEGIHKDKLMQINKEANEGNPKLWNTIRTDLLCDGVVKLGEKYGVPLEKPVRIDAYGNIRLMVVQDDPQIRRMMHE